MTSNERARVAYSVFKEAADSIENTRIELYSYNIIDDPDDKSELDNMLFKIQSDLRYRTKEILECYEKILDDGVEI